MVFEGATVDFFLDKEPFEMNLAEIQSRIDHLEAIRIFHVRIAEEHDSDYARAKASGKIQEIDEEIKLLRSKLPRQIEFLDSLSSGEGPVLFGTDTPMVPKEGAVFLLRQFIKEYGGDDSMRLHEALDSVLDAKGLLWHHHNALEKTIPLASVCDVFEVIVRSIQYVDFPNKLCPEIPTANIIAGFRTLGIELPEGVSL